ncbi:MAG: hypothetical protein EXR75_06205 [Myxococcales bacterium]|nr:hypothetical protein [Myxococcales bacterium]
MRWRDPARSIRTVAGYASVQQELVETYMNAPRALALELLGSHVDPAVFGALVDPSAPIDFVIAADTSPSLMPTPFMGISIGITSLDRALGASSGKPDEIGSGVFKLGSGDSFGQSCAVMRSNGRTPARLVCGDRTRDLTKLGPYMARTLTTEASVGGDIHGELTLRPIFDKYGSKWALQAQGLPVLASELLIGIPKFDQAVKDSAAAVANEAGALMKDLDGVTFDASIDPSAGMTTTMELRLRDKTSWAAKTMVSGASRAAPAPPIFWHLPASSTSAGYGFGADPTLWEPIFATGRALIEGGLEKQNVAGAADRKALAALFRIGESAHDASVAASGSFPDASAGASAFAQVLGQTVGWHIVGMQGRPKATTQYVKDVVAAYNRPGLAAWLKTALGAEARFLPTVKVVAAPRELGAGATALKLSVANIPDPMAIAIGITAGSGAANPTTITVELHLLVMVDGERSYVGLALDRDRLANLMQSLRGAAPGPESLKQLATLARFRQEKHNSATFFTLQGVIGGMQSSLSNALSAAPSGMGSIGRVLLGQLFLMPNKGVTPIVVYGDVADGPRPKVSFTFHAPSPALADFGFIVEKAIALAMGVQP